MGKKVIDLILGIRPDVIRASLLLKKLDSNDELDFRFIWSGQHYSENLKDIFFQQLGVNFPHYELNVSGDSDHAIVADVINKLGSFYANNKKPEVSIFLGDTNTVMGAIASSQHNIPIAHIEGCMRSYDWEMPEEKYRTTVDHLSDVIYAYFDEYKKQGVSEGLRPDSIVVTQNLIVDVLNEFYFNRLSNFDNNVLNQILKTLKIDFKKYFIATVHRRENILYKEKLQNIFNLFEKAPLPVIFAAGYRTQKMMKEFEIVPKNTVTIDPIGYQELLTLMNHSSGVLTDSGTVIEEASILGIPAVQLRKSTERPQVYDVGGAIKFDPNILRKIDESSDLWNRFNLIQKGSWSHSLGDGNASNRIYEDLMNRLNTSDGFKNHLPQKYHIDTHRSYL